MKNFFRQHNGYGRHVAKSRRTNARRVEGECLTEEVVLERLRAYDLERSQKSTVQFMALCRNMFA